MAAKAKSPHERLADLAEEALAHLEAEAKRGRHPSASELNGVRRVLDATEARKRQDEDLERLNALTRG